MFMVIVMRKVKTKVFEKLRDLFTGYWDILLFYILCFFLVFYDTGYMIETPGGYKDLTERITIANAYPSEGSFGMTYVSMIKGCPLAYLLSFVFDSWDAVPVSNLTYPNEDYEVESKRGKIQMESSIDYAVLNAASLAEIPYQVMDDTWYISYVALEQSELRALDEIVSFEGTSVRTLEDLSHILESHEVGDQIPMEIRRDGELMSVFVTVHDKDGSKKIGVTLEHTFSIESDPEITVLSDKNESGPSGGLMLTLAIYNRLVPTDITGGKKIAGTGEINETGQVIAIGGVTYKLEGAVRKGASIFLCPEANYEEALAYRDRKGYSIPILSVSNVTDAIEQLNAFVGQ